jgi:hypothetical protein
MNIENLNDNMKQNKKNESKKDTILPFIKLKS